VKIIMDLQKEFSKIDFKSKRLESRFIKTMEKLSRQPDKSIWLSMGSRSESKAVYRMFANEKLDKDEILNAHRDATKQRILALPDNKIILVIQDTMSVNYSGHTETEGMGYNCEKTLGINTHSCLAVSHEGLTLGLLSQSSITRSVAKINMTGYEKKQRDIEEKESNRWLETMTQSTKDMPPGIEFLHICDREGDMYELFEKAISTCESFLIRVVQNRLTSDGRKIVNEIKKAEPKGEITVVIPRDSRRKIKKRESTLNISFKNFDIAKPKNRSKNTVLMSSVNVNVIYVKEKQPDEKIEPVEWILMTNKPIQTAKEAFRYVGYYIQRWKIERFHFVLKSGCTIEKIQLRKIEKINLLILLYSIIAVKIMNMTYLARLCPDLSCDLIFEEDEWKILYCVVNKTKDPPDMP
jgi:hypothetical protein